MGIFERFRRRRPEPQPTPVEEDNPPRPAEEERVEHEPPSPEPALPEGAYTSSDEHLWDHLRRIDQLIRAQTVHWRMTIGASKPEHLWGMVHVTDAEVNAYLRSAFSTPDDVSSVREGARMHYWQVAEALGLAIASRQAATQPQDSLRLLRLQEKFGLTDLERDLVLLCLLSELDGRYRRLYGYLQDDVSRNGPTVELALQILQPMESRPREWRATFDKGATLLTQRLLLLDANGYNGYEEVPLPLRSLRLDERIAAFLLDNDRPDGRLRGAITEFAGIDWRKLRPYKTLFATDIPTTNGESDADSRALEALEGRIAHLKNVAAWWKANRNAPCAGAALLLHGPYGSGRLAGARAICKETNTPLLVIDVSQALRVPEGWDNFVPLSFREARLRDAALFWAGCEALLEPEQNPQRWNTLVAATEAFPGLCFLASQTAWDPAGRFRDKHFVSIAWTVPHYRLRMRLWEHHLSAHQASLGPDMDLEKLLEELANSFQFTEGQILDALVTAKAEAARRAMDHPQVTKADLFEGCRRQSSRHLITFAHRIEPRTELTFDHLILPDANKRQLKELHDRIRLRGKVFVDVELERRLSLGKGLIVLFTGSSGTGKTMAAELLAHEQGVDLYKVDLSAIASKWVGETEKNLNRLFDDAEHGNSIIFFDEADSLFGKRGEVKDAQDRWANMEINYLLQRLEEYDGVVILASNLRQNIDEAFMRRIQWQVDFPFPDERARCAIYCSVFPPTVVHPSKAEIQVLADRFRLTGGNIKNIVVDAIYRAEAAQSYDDQGKTVVTLRHLVLSTAREYQKLGKPITRGEFGEPFHEWVEDVILCAPLPDLDARLGFWLRAVPSQVVRPNDEEMRELAKRFGLRRTSAGNATRDAIAAAQAADSRKDEKIWVTLRHLVLAAAREYRRLEKPIEPQEVGATFYQWIADAGLLQSPSVS